MARDAGSLRVVFEDDWLIGLVKPAGLPTANVPRGQESVVTRLRDRFGQEAFLGIVSRLDAPVSGVLVVAKTPAAAASLAEQFRLRSVEKRYLAVVEGRFPAPLGAWVEWQDVVAREPGQRRSVVRRGRPGPGEGGSPPPGLPEMDGDADGPAFRAAEVRARVLHRAGEASLVELAPTTGRRHQLRVQLAERGCPIVGDRVYGSRLPFPEGIALHAASLALDHPRDATPMMLNAAPPEAWHTRFPWIGRALRQA